MKSPVIIAVMLVIIIIFGWFVLDKHLLQQTVPEITTTTISTSTEAVAATTDIIPTDSNGRELLATGTPFTTDPYKIFLAQNYEDTTYVQFTYTKQNVIQSGPYAGYTQVLATRTYDGPSIEGPGVFAFITKDFKTFLVTMQYSLSPTPWERFNKNVVTGVADFNISHPAKIQYGGLTYGRHEIYQPDLQYVYNTKGSRLFKFGDLSAYAEMIRYGNSNEGLGTYVQGTSRLLVEDSFGVIFAYSPIPKGEEYSGVYFDKTDFRDIQNSYAQYGDVIPSSCGMPRGNKVLKNIDDTDVEKVGELKNGTNLYALKDKNHLFYKEQFELKITNQLAYFESLNPDRPKVPSYEEYITKNPVLLYKDIWGRWNIIGEFDYRVDAGCGKPVIYLYPEKATDVSVSFINSVKLGVNIPTYSNGWKVTAYPDGTLVDLQKEKTDCSLIDVSKHGSEYAGDACKTGMYPYIYWAGDVDASYPMLNEGFVVAQKDLKKTLEEKLSAIGLSEKETTDMLEYWYPYLLEKNFPFYRLTFFQNKEMNTFVPMNVSPRPQTVIRVFLDWEGLSEKVVIKPQVLNHIERKGFTLVEWGGLKK